MDRLDACYFCGTAGEAPLREVSIAPRARRGDPEATVAATLCPSCEGKLQNVLGRLFDHVESRRVGGEGDAAEGSAGTGPDPGSGATTDRRSGAEADQGSGPTADDGGVAGAGEPGRAAPDEADHRVDRIDVSGERDDERRGGSDRRPLFDPAPDIQEVPEPAANEDDAPADDASSAETATDAPGSTGADPSGEDAEIIADEEDGPTVRARATASAGDPLDGVSVAEYNRVLRLLQNREFPMAREAFVDLASSAYDLEAGTVEQVLDAVVEKGALAERDGDLVRPGGTGGEAP